MRYVVEFPATVRVFVESNGGDDEAFAASIGKAKEAVDALEGCSLLVSYRKGEIVERVADPDPRD